jgi:acetoacetyl-CoA reductase
MDQFQKRSSDFRSGSSLRMFGPAECHKDIAARWDAMGRFAFVTGGTRGIGAAIARSLRSDGHVVVATYHGNAFRRESGTPSYKWNVAHYDACEAGVRQVAKDFGGPVEILVNNAGITRDVMLHKMTPAQWN